MEDYNPNNYTPTARLYSENGLLCCHFDDVPLFEDMFEDSFLEYNFKNSVEDLCRLFIPFLGDDLLILNQTYGNYTNCVPNDTSFNAYFAVIYFVEALFGIAGNSVMITVLARKQGRVSSTDIYFISLAVSDMLILLNNALYHSIGIWFEAYLDDSGSFGCKLLYFLLNGSVQMSSWFLVAVTIERVTSILLPHKVRLYCSPSSSCVVVVVITLAISALNSFYVVAMKMDFANECNMDTTAAGLYFYVNVQPWIDFTIAFAVPFCLILIGNVTILYQLIKKHSQRKKISSSKRNFDTSVTITLLLINITFLITMSPYRINFLLNPNTYMVVDNLLLRNTMNALQNLNSVANFYLYFISGSKFRAEVKSLFCSCRTSATRSN